MFTTRPELRGTFGMVASTHWLASQTGMAVLERGGNAFDAAVATGFVLQVVEPHLNGPGGEVPAVFWSAARGEPLALCGQGVAPSAATIERFHELGHELVPGTGVLAACVPGAFGGWLLLLRDFGTWRIGDVLEFAIGYAEHGYPLHERIRATIELNEELITSWPGSRDLYLPAPEPGALFRNPALGATYRRIVDESRGGSREDEIEKARLAWYEGFVAEEIDRFSASEGGLLTGADMAAWRATRRAGRDVRLSRADRVQDAALGGRSRRPAAARAPSRASTWPSLSSAELVHVISECGKLAFADRDALYGDCDGASRDFFSRGVQRWVGAGLVGESASADVHIRGVDACQPFPTWPRRGGRGSQRRGHRAPRHRRPFRKYPLSDAERRVAAELPRHLLARLAARDAGADVLARGGAAFVAPARNAPANDAVTRGSRFATASRISRGERREATSRSSGRSTSFLRHVDLGMNLQEAIDAPEFHTDHLISSFFPRGFLPKSLALESRFDARTVSELQRRGHDVTLWPAWSAGRVTAVAREPDGLLRAGGKPARHAGLRGRSLASRR